MNQTPAVYLGDRQRRFGIFRLWEKQRNRRQVHWFMECFAEALGVFLYVFPGVGSSVAYVLGGFAEKPGLANVFQVGFAYALGILFAIGICTGTSGGHLNPAVTIAHVIFRRFPIPKAFRYIVAQIFGGYVACMLVYYQWKPLIDEMVDGTIAAGHEELLFTPNGAPGAFALYLLPDMKLGAIFLNEFVCSFFAALVIWAASDPTNMSITPSLAAPYVALSYAALIWSFSTPGIALNTARDLGGRLWVLTIWGLKASGGRYAAISALTNIPATIFAITLYEVFLVDSDRLITPEALEFERLAHGNRRLGRHHHHHHRHHHHQQLQHEPVLDASMVEKGQTPSDDSKDSGKASIDAFEVAPGTERKH